MKSSSKKTASPNEALIAENSDEMSREELAECHRLRKESNKLRKQLDKAAKENEYMKQVMSERLPGDWLDEYLEHGKVKRRVMNATILFVGLKDFEQYYQRLSLTKVVDLSIEFQMAVKEIADKHSLFRMDLAEGRVQLAGNMVFGDKSFGSVVDVIDAGFEILTWLDKKSLPGMIGITTGEVAFEGKITCDVATVKAVASCQQATGGDPTRFQFHPIPKSKAPELKGRRDYVARCNVTRP